MSTLYVICIVLGFAFEFLAQFSIQFPATRVSRGFWLVAALIWALGRLHGG